ncbi:MAG TPA: hypothetical protein VFI72_09065 [Candidatus Angelobacter sp.]|nr:hypothetical protein [Candidatus Angelobacter sp.]
MILTYKLVELIEMHSEPLAASLLEKVKASPLLQEYRNVPAADLRDRVLGIYSHLGEWLTNREEGDIRTRYVEIGSRRAAQGVPLSQLAWTIILTKENLWEYLKRNAIAADLTELSGELEMLQLLDQFFDRAIYYAALGYEQYQAAKQVA